jgi:hypothetical protein
LRPRGSPHSRLCRHACVTPPGQPAAAAPNRTIRGNGDAWSRQAAPRTIPFLAEHACIARRRWKRAHDRFVRWISLRPGDRPWRHSTPPEPA